MSIYLWNILPLDSCLTLPVETMTTRGIFYFVGNLGISKAKVNLPAATPY